MGNKILILGALLTLTLSASAQRREFSKGEEIVAEAVQQMDAHVASEDFKSFLILNKVHGTYNFNITIRAKGSKSIVSSISIESREGGDIPSQNTLKDYIKELKLDMKIPKAESYKFNYTFNNLNYNQ